MLTGLTVFMLLQSPFRALRMESLTVSAELLLLQSPLCYHGRAELKGRHDGEVCILAACYQGRAELKGRHGTSPCRGASR